MVVASNSRLWALSLMPPVFHVASKVLGLAEMCASTQAVLMSGLLLLVALLTCMEDVIADFALDVPRSVFMLGTFLALQLSFGTFSGLKLKSQRDLWAEVVFCAFCEELAFRRLVPAKVRRSLLGAGVREVCADPLAVMASSVLFAAFHIGGLEIRSDGGHSAFVQHFLAGLVFCIAASTGGLATAISLHTTINIHVFSGVSNGMFDFVQPSSLAGSVAVLGLALFVRRKRAGNVREFARM